MHSSAVTSVKKNSKQTFYNNIIFAVWLIKQQFIQTNHSNNNKVVCFPLVIRPQGYQPLYMDPNEIGTSESILTLSIDTDEAVDTVSNHSLTTSLVVVSECSTLVYFNKLLIKTKMTSHKGK